MAGFRRRRRHPSLGADGKELYYVNPAGEMMAVPIAFKGDTVQPGTPVRLFATRIVGGGAPGNGAQFAVAPDGRFLINTVLEDDTAPITLLQNWRPPVP